MKGRHNLLLGTELIFTDDKGNIYSLVNLPTSREQPSPPPFPENHDWNKRSLVHVANTEQRIAFQEVTLIPKNQESNAKGKQKAPDPASQDQGTLAGPSAGITTSLFQPPTSTKNLAAAEIDTLTGVLSAPSPTPRAPRKKKEPAASSSKSKSGRKKSDKGKGKEKEPLASPESNHDAARMAVDGLGDDDLADIYMDE